MIKIKHSGNLLIISNPSKPRSGIFLTLDDLRLNTHTLEIYDDRYSFLGVHTSGMYSQHQESYTIICEDVFCLEGFNPKNVKLPESRSKIINWTSGGNTPFTVNGLYKMLSDLSDDDKSP